VARTLRQLKRAHTFLKDPSRTLDAFSDCDKASDLTIDRLRSHSISKLGVDTSALADTTVPLSPIPPNATFTSCSSLPNLHAGAPDTTFLPLITDTSKAGVSIVAPSPSGRSHTTKTDEPLLSAWWSKTRSWNIGITKQDLKARRQTLGLPGGTVLLGNGRMANFNSSNYLAKGNFFASRSTKWMMNISHCQA